MKTNEMHPAATCGAAPPGRALRRGARPLVMALALAAAAAGCSKGKQQDRTEKDRTEMIKTHVDREWFRQSLVQDNLAHWLSAAPTPNGFFRTNLDRQWRPAADQTGTLVSQSRMLFVLATGYEVTGDAAYLEAVRKGAEFLIGHFRDEECGGWSWSVSPEGTVLDWNKNSYGHAFVIFGLSHAARVTGEKRFAEAALSCWEDMKKHLRYAGGGIKPGTNRDFSRVRGGNTQNPMMHLFEALLALHDATGSQTVFDDAGELAEFIFGRLYQAGGGFLPEQYDEQWKPLPVADGGYVDLGHQFEWAFLLSRAVEKGFPDRYLKIGGRLLDYGMKIARDAANGGIFSSGDYDGKVIRPGKGWWQQCELLRALVHYAGTRGREDLWPAFGQSLQFVKANFLDAEFGGWYGADTAGKTPRGRAGDKGSTWKVGYHDTGMYAEALRLTGGVEAR